VPVRVGSAPDGATFTVRVVPRAGRTAVAGVRGDALLVRLAAAPVDGAANEALITFLARLLDRPPRDLTLVSGQASRDKRIAVRGYSPGSLAARLEAILPPADTR
jgi:uncharacterized protein